MNRSEKVPRAIALRSLYAPVASWAVPSGREAEQEQGKSCPSLLSRRSSSLCPARGSCREVMHVLLLFLFLHVLYQSIR